MKQFIGCLCTDVNHGLKIIEVTSRDINEITTLPDNTYAYFFFDYASEQIDPELNAHKVKNLSHITYWGGQIYTFEEFKQFIKENQETIRLTIIPGTPITKAGKMHNIIRTVANTWMPFFEEDLLINGIILH